MRAHQNTWGRVSQAQKIGLSKRQRGLDAFVVYRSSGMNAGRCMQMIGNVSDVHVHSGFPTGRSEQMIVMS